MAEDERPSSATERLLALGGRIPGIGLRIRPFAPDSVTRAAPDEIDPGEVGVHPEDVEAMWQTVARYYARGLHPALALCVLRRGRVLLDRAIGHSRGNLSANDPGPAVQATPETLFSMFSGSKAITAMLLHGLEERGELSVEDRVVRYLPKFGRHGKHLVTLRHLLTHRAGIPSIDVSTFDLRLLDDPEAIVELLSDLKPESIAGRKPAYHALSSGFLIGAVIRKVTGATVRELLEVTVTKPTGIQSLRYGVPPDQTHRAALHAFTGPPSVWPFRSFMVRSLGLDLPALVETANDPRFMSGIVPSGNVFGTPRDIARFFELLRRKGELEGVQVFKPRTVLRAVAEQYRSEIDDIIKLPLRYSMGFMLGEPRLSLFGPNTSAAFGHLGFTNVVVWADPSRDLSVALMNTGKPFIAPDLLLWMNIMETISTRVPKDGDRDWSKL